MDPQRAIRVKRAERYSRIFILLLGLPLLVFASVRFLGESLTFAPYTIHAYDAVPPQGCVNELVSVKIDQEVRRPILGSVASVTSVLRWEQAPNASTPGGQAFIRPFSGDYGREAWTTEQDRLTPNAPGRWYLHVEVMVDGRVLFSPRVQRASWNSPEIFTALPESDPRCS